MITCDIHNRSKIIVGYLTGELPEAEMQEFETHYFQCKACFRELQLAEDALRLIEKEGPGVLNVPEPWWKRLAGIFSKPLTRRSESGHPRLAYGRLAIAALALVVLIALPIRYVLFRGEPAKPNAENFQPSPFFENLLNQRYQSDKLLSEVSPENDANFKNEIRFQWKLQEGIKQEGGFNLRIFNNKAEELFRFDVAENQFLLKEVLPPGLYYWALLTKEEMVYVGRFYID